MNMSAVEIIVIFLLVILMVLLVVGIALPKDHWDTYPACDAPLPLWKVHHSNAIGVYSETYVRMTPEEAAEYCPEEK